MRYRPNYNKQKNEKLGKIIGIIICIIMSPIILFMATILGVLWLIFTIKAKLVGPYKEWTDWYAWRPIQIGWEWVWLETIQRRSYDIMSETEYKLKG